ncbi:MAG: MFS transporter [Rhodopila sp.]
MNEWRTLLAASRFRAFWLALLCDNLGSWCVIAAMPILVADRFGAGLVLVASLALRILPKLVLAPVAAGLIRRVGPARLASTAMLLMAGLTAALPWCRDLALLEVLIAAIGALDLFIIPGLLTLRTPVTPPGLEMAGNTLCSVADRAAKVAGPALGGLAVLAGFDVAFTGFALLIAASAVPVARLSTIIPVEADARRGNLWSFLAIIRGDREVLGLLVAGVTYMVLLGGLRPFLFWANSDWYGASNTAWTWLLAAQGAGALVGALVSVLVVPGLLRRMSAYRLSLLTGLAEGAAHLLLAATSSVQAIAILALAGIPEIISTAAWFTAIQARLSAAQQGSFYTVSAPLWDLAFALGIASAGLHAQGVLSLSVYWALVSLIATLPLLPLLGWGRER